MISETQVIHLDHIMYFIHVKEEGACNAVRMYTPNVSFLIYEHRFCKFLSCHLLNKFIHVHFKKRQGVLKNRNILL
ncbi:hypothetical protein FKM82_003086 [Ascaphus truei]